MFDWGCLTVTSSQTLADLRRLQSLREQQSKAEHALAVCEERTAAKASSDAETQLTAQYHALDHYAAQGKFQIEQFQIFSQLITNTETKLQKRREVHADAKDKETTARQNRIKAERQSEHLADRYCAVLRKERRKKEDGAAREFLSQVAASKGTQA